MSGKEENSGSSYYINKLSAQGFIQRKVSQLLITVNHFSAVGIVRSIVFSISTWIILTNYLTNVEESESEFMSMIDYIKADDPKRSIVFD